MENVKIPPPLSDSRNDDGPIIKNVLCDHAGRGARAESVHRHHCGSAEKVCHLLSHTRSLSLLNQFVHRVLKKRTDLKVIVSSATLDAEDFYRYFNTNETSDAAKNNVAIMSVEGRMYPVDILYLESPCHNYIDKARDLVFDIHKTVSCCFVRLYVVAKLSSFIVFGFVYYLYLFLGGTW